MGREPRQRLTSDDLDKTRPGRAGKFKGHFAFETARPTKDDLEKQKDKIKRSSGQPFPPAPATARAVLLERDNPAELLEFHWDPTTYRISKEAKWTTEDPVGGTDTLEHNGSSLTKVSFTLFLDDIGLPSDRRKNDARRGVDDSIAWLYQRLSNRTQADVDRRGRNSNPSPKWMNIVDPEADKHAPVMVLFAFKVPFECVLKSCSLNTEWQAGRSLTTIQGGLSSGGAIDEAIRKAGPQESFGGDIRRAHVAVELWQYDKKPE